MTENTPPLSMQIGVTTVVAAVNLAMIWFLLTQLGPAGLIILGLYLLAPLIRMLTEIAFGPVTWSWRNLVFGYLAVLLHLLFLLGAQLAWVPFQFLVGPVWVLMLLITLVDLAAAALAMATPSPLLCNWAGIGGGLCLPAQLAYHGLSAAGLYIGVRHGERLLDAAVVLPRRAADWLEGKMER